MRSYERIVRAVAEAPWAIRPEVLAVILDIIAFRRAGGKLTDDEIRDRIGSNVDRAEPTRAGGVAILPLQGPIFPKANLMTAVSGATSLEVFRSQLREALASDDVTSIVLDVDSPGGIADMVPETAEEIRSARGTKPIVAVANTQAGSAAYWIASQADELVVTPSGDVGSIGVWSSHVDISKAQDMAGIKTSLVSAGKFKTEGNPWEPLSDEARAAMQATIDEMYGLFVAAVAKGRGASVKAVREGFGQGRMVTAMNAMKEGMVDRVATLDETVRRLGGGRFAPVPLVKEDPLEDLLDEDEDEDAASSIAKPVRSDVFVRALAVDDIVVRSEGEGRTVEAYAAVFDTPTRVTDFYYLKDNPYEDEFGTYEEILRPRVFEKSLRERGKDFQVMFNHGRDIFGFPTARFAMPLAAPVEVKADARGLWTVTRYAKTELADEALELIRAGAVRAMSFSGRPLQTKLTRGRPDTLERLEIVLQEFGPCIFPTYNDAKIVGVRAEALAHQLAYLPADERVRLASMLQGTPLQAARPGTDPGEPSADTDTSSGAGEKPPASSGPSLDVLLLQQEQRRRSAGIR